MKNNLTELMNKLPEAKRMKNHVLDFDYRNLRDIPECGINYFFGNKEGFENIEVGELEINIGWTKEDDKWEWGRKGRGLLNYFLRYPLTKPTLIEYVQSGVKELSENSKLRKKLTNLLIREEGLFRTPDSFGEIMETYYKVHYFGNYQKLLKKVANLLKSSESECLKDIRKSLVHLLNDEKFLRALQIAQGPNHNLRITGDQKIKKYECSDEEDLAHTISYVLKEGNKIDCFTFWSEDLYDYRDHTYGKFNAYNVVWEAITKTLTESGFEALENVAFDGAFLGYLNGLASLVDLYKKNNVKYTFPKINHNNENELFFEDAVHPLLIENNPVPNNVNLNTKPSIYVIAGPNNAGKTTYLKKIGLLTLMSQIGAPIPALEARVTPVKHVYTHFPKTESVLSGKGRFVDELERLNNIFENADEHDLILLDEPCSGTSNEDSIDVSMDVVYGLQEIGCPTIYSTHLHEIQTRLDGNEKYSNCMNLRIETKGTRKNPIFTHNIIKGIAGKSYGTVYARKLLPVEKILRKRKII